MTPANTHSIGSPSESPGHRGLRDADLVDALRRRYESEALTRRGICLLNAGQWPEAEASFRKAQALGGSEGSLPSYIAACLRARGQDADSSFADRIRSHPEDAGSRVRYALALWSAGRSEAAVATLREGIRLDHDQPELHYQLGVMLGARDCYDEAELRFVQALNLDPGHVGAMVQLACCAGHRGAPTEAVALLQKAQARRPVDTGIALLLSLAARAARDQGVAVRVRAEMGGEDPCSDQAGVEELSRVIESDPEFVDALLSVPLEQVDARYFAMLLRTIEVALERQPEHAELLFHCGRVLDRLGRADEAVVRGERAVSLHPTSTRFLIELAHLYQKSDRMVDAQARLEQAVALGADYADVHCALGAIYQKRGEILKAKSAYKRALAINERYGAARRALEALPAGA